ncbi:unnamed protein product [Gordionus sp. m RMFG-2023]
MDQNVIDNEVTSTDYSKIFKKWVIKEDEAIAARLQNNEFSDLFDKNRINRVENRKIIDLDTKKAKELQKIESNKNNKNCIKKNLVQHDHINSNLQKPCSHNEQSDYELALKLQEIEDQKGKSDI